MKSKISPSLREEIEVSPHGSVDQSFYRSSPVDLDNDVDSTIPDLEKDSPTKSLSYDDEYEHPFESHSATDCNLSREYRIEDYEYHISNNNNDKKKKRRWWCCFYSTTPLCCKFRCSHKLCCTGIFISIFILILLVSGLCIGLLGPWRDDPTSRIMNPFDYYSSDCSSTICCNGLPSNCYLRVNEVVWAASHNSMATKEDGYLAAYNHFNTIEESFVAGYRVLLIDLCDCDGTDSNSTGLQLCHGTCKVGTTNPSVVIESIRNFLIANPSEVLLLELQVAHNNNGGGNSLLSMFYDKMVNVGGGIVELIYEHPAQHVDWPLMKDLIQNNTRLIIFQHDGPDCNIEGNCPIGFHNTYTYMFETPWDLKGVDEVKHYKKSCKLLDRGASPERNNTFFLLNHFATNRFGLPDSDIADEINDKSILEERINICEEQVGHLVNIIAVDYWSLGDVPEVTQGLNIRNGITTSPSSFPSTLPTLNPSMLPTAPPTNLPTTYPSSLPTSNPTTHPTILPTIFPTTSPTLTPTTTTPPTMSATAVPSSTTLPTASFAPSSTSLPTLATPTTASTSPPVISIPTTLVDTTTVPTTAAVPSTSSLVPSSRTSLPTVEADEPIPTEGTTFPALFPTSVPSEASITILTDTPTSISESLSPTTVSPTFGALPVLSTLSPTRIPTFLQQFTASPTRTVQIHPIPPTQQQFTASPTRTVQIHPIPPTQQFTASPTRTVQIHPIPPTQQSCYYSISDTCMLVDVDCNIFAPCPRGGVCIDNSDVSFECGQRECKNTSHGECNGEECRSDSDCIDKFGQDTICVSSSNDCGIPV